MKRKVKIDVRMIAIYAVYALMMFRIALWIVGIDL